MLLDAKATFSDAQAITALGNTNSTKSVDLGPNVSSPPNGLGGSVTYGQDIGKGNAPEILAQVVEAFTSAGAGTLQVQVITADNEALTTNPTVHNQSGVVALADLKPGYQFAVAVPPGVKQRYLGLRYVVGTAAMTAGKVTAGIVALR